jgi:hypothetical protein
MLRSRRSVQLHRADQRVRGDPRLAQQISSTGIVSMNDILPAAGKRGVGNAEIVDTFQAICAHRHPTPHVTAA